MLWIFSFPMLLLLLQGMLGIALIGACRENESSCNLTSLSGREWIRLIEHHSQWEHELSLSLCRSLSLSLSLPAPLPRSLSVTQTLPNTPLSYRQSINTSGIILIRLFAACVPCHALSIKRRKKRSKKEGEKLRRELQYTWGPADKPTIAMLGFTDCLEDDCIFLLRLCRLC